MDLLEEYLLGEKPADQRDIEAIEKLLEEVGRAFLWNFDQSTAWRYEIRGNLKSGRSAGGVLGETEAVAPVSDRTTLSQGTSAMIAGALLRLAGHYGDWATRPKRSNAFPFNFDDKAVRDGLVNNAIAASQALLSDFERLGGAYSSTFGQNDVFTTAWLAQLASANWEEVDAASFPSWLIVGGELMAMSAERQEAWSKAENPALLLDPSTVEGMPPSRRGNPVRHAFPVLRLVQTIRDLVGEAGGALPVLFKYFEELLHEQLSFSSIPDSRFDPAELAFCLEGMLLCQRSVVERSLFERVLEVLTTAQRDSAYWRPVKPFLATKQGLTLFPVSVEVANSLLRSCEIFDGDELLDTFSSRCVPLFRRYWQWLRARAVRLGWAQIDLERNSAPELPSIAGLDIVGWHSEHVNEPTVIHLWETSQVVEFLLGYRNVLHQHIARTTLIRSRFKVTEYRKKRETWEELVEKYEPVNSQGPELQVYRSIDRNFVVPRRDSPESGLYSMLLYGPPGTGKTTVAESLAYALESRLITITVSDFLAGGGAQVEARAKDIFDVLLAQPKCVVLFDEIDHFLLDRDSDRYSDQDTVFQFMTPGMLTKLNDLRRSKRAVFIVATNYEDRIDAAIKRTGRVDVKYLVLPPDKARRKSSLESIIKSAQSRKPALHFRDIGAAWDDLARASLFLGFTDLQATVETFEAREHAASELVARLHQRSRTISMEMYISRFPQEATLDPAKLPVAEFLGLLALACEVFDAPEKGVARVLKDVSRVLKKCCGGEFEELLSSHSPVRNPATLIKIARWLREAAS